MERNITRVHDADFLDKMKLLFPNGFDGILASRRKSLIEDKIVIHEETPDITVLGGKITILVTFNPE